MVFLEKLRTSEAMTRPCPVAMLIVVGYQDPEMLIDWYVGTGP